MVHDVAVVRTPSLKARSASVRKASIYGSPMSIAIITLAGLVALGTSLTTTISLSSVALGLSYASVQVLALCLVERARKDNQQKLGAESRRRVSATGLPILSEGSLLSNQDPWRLVLQDVSLAAATVTLIATVMFESLQFGGLVCFGLIDRIIGEHWMEGQVFVSSIIGAVMVLVHCIMNASLVLMVSAKAARRLSSFPFVKYTSATSVPPLSRPRTACFDAPRHRSSRIANGVDIQHIQVYSLRCPSASFLAQATPHACASLRLKYRTRYQ
jgi:hypothetical protein